MYLHRSKKLFKKLLGPVNVECIDIVRRSLREIRQVPAAPGKSYPVPLEELKAAVEEAGVVRGDTVMVHSSASSLYKASRRPTPETAVDIFRYSKKIIEMLVELVGPGGTILMNTDSLRGWPLVMQGRYVFDYTRSPSRRGWISEMFRRRPDVIRSVHPWYNVSGWGRLAEELLSDHHKSTPYAMDRNSPWYKLTRIGGKILLLGVAHEGNASLILTDYLHHEEHPHAVFLNKPYKVKYRDYDGEIKEMDVLFHARHATADEVKSFMDCLERKHPVYRKVRLYETQVACCESKAQYEAVYQEMLEGFTISGLGAGNSQENEDFRSSYSSEIPDR